MDLMLLEQIKQQQEMEQQGSSSFTDGGDGEVIEKDEMNSHANISSPAATIQEIQVQPDVSHLIDGPMQNQPTPEESTRIGCSFCFHVFKTEAALTRHTAKFHSEAN